MPRSQRLGWLALIVALIATGAFAMPERDVAEVEEGVEALKLALETPGAANTSTLELFFHSGLSDWVAGPVPAAPVPEADLRAAPKGAPQIEEMDLRLPLARISQSFGGKELGAVRGAQRPGPMTSLVVRRGVARLADIRAHIDLSEDQALRRPLVIWPGAALHLEMGEVLTLSRPDGAFLLNFGHLRIDGATVRSAGAENARIPRFRPFVTTSAEGVLEVTGGRFEGLGFGQTHKFGGLVLLKNALMPSRLPSFVRESAFHDTGSVFVHGVAGVEVSGNRFHAARDVPVIVDAADHARVLGNLFDSDAPGNAIRVLNGAKAAVVSGNVVLGGEKTGIMVRGARESVQVSHNLVWGRRGGGVTVVGSDCAAVQSNLILGNRQKGIEVRSSAETRVRGNLISGNRSAGIWVSGQEDQALTRLEHNVLHRNGAGISTATGAHLMLVGNDISQQMPRLLGGDLSRQAMLLARDLSGAVPISLSANGPVDLPSHVPECAR
ncbi:MAG: right-handed parallel beta-helix repeat-containing protein [Pseudomonadota bacterium]